MEEYIMEITPCKACGRLFNYVSGVRICTNCQKKLEEKFAEVKKFVRENPAADINTISQEMDVSVAQIKRWIREERLTFTKDSPVGLPCENCGAMIHTGRFCEKCKSKLANGLSEAAGLNRKPNPEPARKSLRDSSSKMRFLEK